MDVEILEPRTIAEAAALRAEHGDEAKLLAGGTALVLMLRNRLVAPRYLISLNTVDGYRDVSYAPGEGLRLGALATIAQAERAPAVREHYPALADTYHQVANMRVRWAATVGGNLTEADYASDPPAMLIALDARVRAEGPRGTREIALGEFFTDFYETALADDEVLTEIVVPEPAPGTRASYLKFQTRSSEDRPCIGVATTVRLNDAGACEDLRVVVGAVAGTPQRVPEAEALARGERPSPELFRAIGEAYAQAIEPIDDIRAAAWYRQRMIGVLVARALGELSANSGQPSANGGAHR
ncbi:MAG TPA: xanthine dehydrogenase family protein subunit M [Chloroflexota bacterium]|nr:xanthine dehydrogenase family protein subunit M [Chloroflexota bacterium]